MNFFILGTHDELATAEIKAVLKDGLVVVAQSRQAILAQPLDRNLVELQERLAGVVKIGYVIGEMPRFEQEEAAQLVAGFALQASGKNKISFGLSVYDIGNTKLTHELERDLDDIGLVVKRLLKEGKRPVRYVKAKEPRLSSAVVEMNGLLSSGGEYVFLAASDRVYIGKTETIQDFRAWEDRDFGRPARDAKSGMLPPKLARLMINLSGVDPDGATLLDPFCGSGTILMEGILLGFEHLIGSDISEEAVKNTKTNLAWLTNHLQLPESNVSLFTTSAALLPPIPKGGLGGVADAIISEVYLGSPRKHPINELEIAAIEKELLPTYETSFRNLKKLLKPSARLVVAFPAFKKEDGSWHRLPLQNLLTKLGYKIQQQYLYHRALQLVGRDIVIFSI